jgi:hypothetical protein
MTFAITLYDDERMRVTRGENIGEKITQSVFYIKSEERVNTTYHFIPYRFMNECFNLKRGELESKLKEIDEKIIRRLKEEQIPMDSAQLVLCLAYHHLQELLSADRESERISLMPYSD